MDWFISWLALAVPIGMASLFWEAWRVLRDKKRSIATAIAIMCIAFGVPTIFIATYLENQPPSVLQQSLRMIGIFLMGLAGVAGAIGLVWDYRIAKLPKKDQLPEQ